MVFHTRSVRVACRCGHRRFGAYSPPCDLGLMAASATTVHHWTNLLHLDDQDWRSGSRKDSRKPIGIVSWTSPLSSWRDFENPLDELVKRHPGIEISFRRIDAHQFTAVAYRDGKAQARCRIFMGAFIGGIAYSANDRGPATATTRTFRPKLTSRACCCGHSGCRCT